MQSDYRGTAANVVTTNLWDSETDEYNTPYFWRMLPEHSLFADGWPRGVMEDDQFHETEVCSPQGGVITWLTVGTINPRIGLAPASKRPCWVHQPPLVKRGKRKEENRINWKRNIYDNRGTSG